MKKFLIRTISFISIFLLLFFMGFGIIVSSHKFLPSDMYYNNEFERAFEERDMELIAIGNSKLLSSLDKGVLEKELGLKSAVLGYSSANISISKLTLESYLNKCIRKPKIVLLEVSWFTFNTKRTHFHDVSGDLFLNDLKLYPKIIKYYPKIIENIKLCISKQVFSKFFPYHNKNYSVIFKNKSPNTKNYNFYLEDFEKFFPDHDAGIDKLLLEDYYEIVEICNNNNIELILYTAPEDELYSSYQNDKNRIKKVFLQSSVNFYLDYTLGGELWSKDYELWLWNSHHINENDLFTYILSKDIKSKLNDIY